MDTIKELQKAAADFRDERDWKQFHNPKDLAISIVLEASELLEIFQWSGSDTAPEGRRDKVEEELADVLLYCFLMADREGLDIEEIMRKKMVRNAEKYPVDKARGRKDKYSEL